MAEYMLHRALIWGATTDPAKFVRTKSNVLAIMGRIASDDDDTEGAAAGARRKASDLSRQGHPAMSSSTSDEGTEGTDS